ncbi:MAG: hypothetical protein IIA45_05070 [Bacteroidetes bacterium]|nr:hypothetical protein [Bacteroidota bacterium]
MRKFLLIVLSLAFLFNNCFAQVSGYQGKRLTVGYNASTFFSMHNKDTALVSDLVYLNTKGGLVVDYVITRRSSIGVTIERFKAKLDYTGLSFIDSVKCDDPIFGEWMDVALLTSTKQVLVKAVNIGVVYKKFIDIAPLGAYQEFGFYQVLYKAEVSDYTPEVGPLSIYCLKNIDDFVSDKIYSATMLTYAAGAQRIIFDKLVLRVAVQTGWVLNNIKGSRFRKEILEIETPFTTKNFLKLRGKTRIGGHELLNIVFGVAYLVK